jgi:S-formylglutathione hydrolase FrmB
MINDELDIEASRRLRAAARCPVINRTSANGVVRAFARTRGHHRFGELTMKRGVLLLRVALVAVLGMCWWMGPITKGDAPVQYLMVPSAAMGRDIPVAFLAGGPHAVYLLDAFDAAPDVSNWVTVGHAMQTLAGRGISVVAPAGGAYSLYTDWKQDGSRQWETFLSSELPDWLAANKGLAPGGHAVVGASQGGYAALALGTFHPDRFRYAGSMSGFLTPERTPVNGYIRKGMLAFGGVDTDNMWGPPQLGGWVGHSPNVHAQLLADNNARLWVFSPQTKTTSDPAAMIGDPEIAQSTNRDFYSQYRAVGGHNIHFAMPTDGDHGWSTWAPQLGAMSSDLAASIR